VAVLYPHEGNLHKFAAGPHSAAVLNVLLPLCNNGCGRDCTYYEVRNLTAGRGPAGGEERRHHATPCLVLPTQWPETFHCVWGSTTIWEMPMIPATIRMIATATIRTIVRNERR
jgi:hypothetical protein